MVIQSMKNNIIELNLNWMSTWMRNEAQKIIWKQKNTVGWIDQAIEDRIWKRKTNQNYKLKICCKLLKKRGFLLKYRQPTAINQQPQQCQKRRSERKKSAHQRNKKNRKKTINHSKLCAVDKNFFFRFFHQFVFFSLLGFRRNCINVWKCQIKRNR